MQGGGVPSGALAVQTVNLGKAADNANIRSAARFLESQFNASSDAGIRQGLIQYENACTAIGE